MITPDLVHRAVRDRKYAITSHESAFWNTRMWTLWDQRGFIVGTYFTYKQAVQKLKMQGERP